MFIKNCLNKISKKYTRASNYYQIHFLLRMVWKAELLYRHFFSTLLQNIPLTRPTQTIKEWNWTESIKFWYRRG